MIFKWKTEGRIKQREKLGGKGLGFYDHPDRREHLVCFNERMRKISRDKATEIDRHRPLKESRLCFKCKERHPKCF